MLRLDRRIASQKVREIFKTKSVSSICFSELLDGLVFSEINNQNHATLLEILLDFMTTPLDVMKTPRKPLDKVKTPLDRMNR